VHRLKKISLLLSVLLLTLNLKAQDAVITILDQQSKQPVPYAIVCFEALDGKAKNNVISDNEGKLANAINKRSVMAVSCIGYVSKMDTIDPKQFITIFLQPTVYNVDEVVVTGQFKAVKADRSIYKVDVINSRQIADKAANNLAELLSNELNVRTSQDASLGTNLNIQGLSGEHVKILVDGVPVIGRQNGILDLSQIALSNVDHIEVVEGPMSVVYGSNALAGAINIITKEPIHGRFIGKGNTYNESVGVYNFDGNLVYRAKEHTINASGGRNFFAGYSAIDTSRSKQWKPKLQYNGNLDYVLTANNNKLRVNTNYFNEELRNKGDVFRNQNTYMAIDEYFYTTRWNASADYLKTFGNQNRLEAIAAYSYYNKTKKATTKDMVTLSENPSSDPLSQDTTIFHNMMSRITFNNSSKDILNYQTGFEGNIETATGKRLNGEKRNGDYAGFLAAIFLPKRKLNTQAGFRFIHNTQFNAPLVYSLNIKYSPLFNLLFRASYGKGFRAPSLKELYLDFVDINHNITGNDQLKSEISNNFNASGIYTFQHNKHTVTFDAMLFYNTFQNKIELVRTNNATTSYTYYNVGGGNYITKGAEVKLQYQFHPRFSFNAGMYLLGRSHIENLDNLYYSTDYTLNFNYKSLRYLFRLSAYYKYTDDWYGSSVQYTDNKVIDKVTPYYMKGYHTLDVTLSRPFFKNRFEIATGLKNLFNNKNVYSYGSSSDNPHSGADAGNTPVGWGRTFFVRVSYNFVKY
jgi:outer membrane receptor for ferrienterochelin and colicins